jgi:hypothetical protein
MLNIINSFLFFYIFFSLVLQYLKIFEKKYTHYFIDKHIYFFDKQSLLVLLLVPRVYLTVFFSSFFSNITKMSTKKNNQLWNNVCINALMILINWLVFFSFFNWKIIRKLSIFPTIFYYKSITTASLLKNCVVLIVEN